MPLRSLSRLLPPPLLLPIGDTRGDGRAVGAARGRGHGLPRALAAARAAAEAAEAEADLAAVAGLPGAASAAAATMRTADRCSGAVVVVVVDQTRHCLWHNSMRHIAEQLACSSRSRRSSLLTLFPTNSLRLQQQ